jgi:hypothetical protein
MLRAAQPYGADASLLCSSCTVGELDVGESTGHWLDDDVVRLTRRPRLKKATRDRLPFLKLSLAGLIRLGQARLSRPATILLLEMLRLAGLRTVQRRGGWVALDHAGLERLGLQGRFIRCRAVKQLVSKGFLVVRGASAAGRKLEYRLNPDWDTPESKVVDLAAAREARTAR